MSISGRILDGLEKIQWNVFEPQTLAEIHLRICSCVGLLLLKCFTGLLPSVTENYPILRSLNRNIRSDQMRSVAQSCLTLCDPMNRSTPGLPVHHQLLEFTKTHVHWVNDLQPSHPLLSPSPPAFNLAQHQGLFQASGSVFSIRWPKYWSFSFRFSLSNDASKMISFRTGWISLQSKGLSRVFSNTTVQKHQFFGAQLSSQSNSHIHMWLLERP